MRTPALPLGLALAAAAAALPGRLTTLYPLSWPPAGELVTRGFEAQDTLLVACGFRRLAADAAWVQLLLYVGTALPEEGGEREFARLRDLTLRVMRLDPHFHKPALFGAATLAWYGHHQHYDEAVGILGEGLRRNPQHWPFATMLAAIGYRQSGQFDKMAAELEKTAGHPDCPALVRSILANSYKARRRYREALAHWLAVLDDPRASDYHARARKEAEWLAARLRTAPR